MRGIEKLAETVAVTLGPRGRNVLLDKASSPSLRHGYSGWEWACLVLAARALVQGEFSAPQIVNDGDSPGCIGDDTFVLAW